MAHVAINGGGKWQKLIAAIAVQNVALRVGFLEGATHSGETSKPGALVAPIAAMQEFGTAAIPPRPFMRQTVAEHSAEWASQMAQLMKSHPQGAEAAMQIMGDVMAKDIQQTIENSLPPPLNPATVAAKARRGKSEPEKTLIDSGAMQEAVAFEVEP